ncbi:aspartyl/glutamyl-tRNA amidotransferase [Brevundimonas phage vB_BpoS-Marchewka]|uniref:Aspartyl/glutamyl-tRNA amidotransferase n=1 Tax=Brevundimonas phage vB_BpoS-Marchewka TaxID=2948604 RepID=A0A9E7N4W9_9CAUD|nr:aspartyl/glutamyl-tRNA amidotransferase [Brevundimonas phage vB_BpoS-Marchewka]
MSTLKDLQDLALQQRKAAAQGDGGEHAVFLAMILSDAAGLAKAQQRPMTDDDAETAIRSTVKAFEKTLAGDEAKGLKPVEPDSDYARKLIAQRDVIAALVPAPLEGHLLAMAIRDAAQATESEISPKGMGKIMGWLNAQYPGRVDGAKVKAVLASGVA